MAAAASAQQQQGVPPLLGPAAGCRSRRWREQAGWCWPYGGGVGDPVLLWLEERGTIQECQTVDRHARHLLAEVRFEIMKDAEDEPFVDNDIPGVLECVHQLFESVAIGGN